MPVDNTEMVKRIFTAAQEVFTGEGVHIWLDAPNPLLGGRTAREAVEDGNGEEVLQALEGLASGAVS